MSFGVLRKEYQNSFPVNRIVRNALTGMSAGLCLVLPLSTVADAPQVLFVDLEHRGNAWTAHVTVRHSDTGWDHYADAWRLVDTHGTVLGTRTLYHPHETEQPFTRSLPGISIPEEVGEIEVQAHDKVHGWGEKVRIPLAPGEGEVYRVR